MIEERNFGEGLSQRQFLDYVDFQLLPFSQNQDRGESGPRFGYLKQHVANLRQGFVQDLIVKLCHDGRFQIIRANHPKGFVREY